LRRSQRFLRLHDVLAEQAHGLLNLAVAAKFEQLIMFALGTLLAGGARHEGTRKAAHMAVVRLDHPKQARAIAGGVERLMEAPVESTPLLRIGLLVVGTKDTFRIVEIDIAHGRDCQTKRMTFERDANLEQLYDLVDRQIGNDRSAIGQEGHEAFGLQLPQRLPHGDSAGTKPLGQFVLPELKAGAELARADSA